MMVATQKVKEAGMRKTTDGGEVRLWRGTRLQLLNMNQLRSVLTVPGKKSTPFGENLDALFVVGPWIFIQNGNRRRARPSVAAIRAVGSLRN
jgi:hypothetical protein